MATASPTAAVPRTLTDALNDERSRLENEYRAAGIDLTLKISRTSTMAEASGGFADIFHGSWNNRDDSGVRNDDNILALKYIREKLYPKKVQKLAILRGLRQEISVWRRFKPEEAYRNNIQPFLGIFWEKDRVLPAIVSSWHERGSVADYFLRLKEGQPPSTHEGLRSTKLSLLRDALAGVKFLHANRIIHADIKEENVLVSSDGRAFLCDFGISWTDLKRSVTFTKFRDPKGTVACMAPEILFAALAMQESVNEDMPGQVLQSEFVGPSPANYDVQPGGHGVGTTRLDTEDNGMLVETEAQRQLYTEGSDMWAFGCLMVQVITGQSPWKSKTMREIGNVFQARKIFDLPAGMDGDTWEIVQQCCAFEPSDRLRAVDVVPLLDRLT